MSEHKYGKKPATYDRKDLLFTEFEKKGAKLKQAPVGFGHDLAVKSFPMFLNDEIGDCVPASRAHQTQMYNKIAGVDVKIIDDNVSAFYTLVGGYDPNDPNTDQGTNMRDAENGARKTGIEDANGKFHKIGGYVALEAGNFGQMLQALRIFDAVDIGFEVPQSAEDQFSDGKPWTLASGRAEQQILGGHCVPIFGRPTAESVRLVTWAAEQRMSKGFYEKYADEAYGIVSEESLVNGRTAEGYDLKSLYAAINAF